jgi:hypothetical protein
VDCKITSSNILYNLVQLDQADHLHRQMASLFLQAMQDWPTPNQNRIDAFLAEATNYFGSPISEDKLKHAPLFDSKNSVWKAEAGSSLLAMLRLSKNHDRPDSLEKICDQMFAYYEREFWSVDFIATLTYKSTEKGGRKTAASSGYRPIVKFPFSAEMTSGQQLFIDKDAAYPGDTLQAKIKLATPVVYYGKLYEQMEFEFKEGSVTVGVGRIDYIVNDALERSE